eukprot:TRINITY_DN13473_c0_g1_i2.p2 TRINITY_DN13473_c0_g1~~TRINITY_DN13473_c0_g1_i2.p2  ORF type:complete len:188 (+),score=49.85 TRINITY_DN13473_c0_g1_i2:28-591(+)
MRRLGGRVMSARPRVVVFDLDGCVWYPEMYHLWGGGGAPFKQAAGGDLTDNAGTNVRLMGDVRAIMTSLHRDAQWKGTAVAVASCCDEPAWARECLRLFQIEGGASLSDVVAHVQIRKAAKTVHMRKIAEEVGCRPEEMIFFDNERGNLTTVAPLGVTCVYTPDGVTDRLWRLGLERFPSPGEVIAE